MTHNSDIVAATRDTGRHAGLLDGIRVDEPRRVLAGVSTSVLEGGEGPPIVLLHGPGEPAVKWFRVLPALIETNRVIAPDLPAHGASDVPDEIGPERMVAWLDDLILETCESPPCVVGHILGGAIAARHASRHSDRLGSLVLVDSLGLARFRPAPRFALTMLGFQLRPTPSSYDRFMRECSYDLDALRDGMGERWDSFAALNVETARSPSAKAVGRMMRAVGLPRIPPEDLESISVPTTLIWGRHDRANPVRIAERSSERYEWPLHVIEDSADDPPLDRPEEFLAALRIAIAHALR